MDGSYQNPVSHAEAGSCVWGGLEKFGGGYNGDL